MSWEHTKQEYIDLINLAVADGYKYDGDPNSKSDNSDGVIMGLNAMAQRGWELVLFYDYYFYFKRPCD